MARCDGCGKPNEYQPTAYTCWECTNVWPREAEAEGLRDVPRPLTGPIEWKATLWNEYWKHLTGFYIGSTDPGYHNALLASKKNLAHKCDNCRRWAGNHTIEGRCHGLSLDTTFVSPDALVWNASR